MGFWDWLTGKASRVAAADTIWLTGPARVRGLCRPLAGRPADDRPVLLLAHFPDTLADVQRELDRQGVPHEPAPHPITTGAVNRLADRGAGGPVSLGLVRHLQPDPFPDESAGEAAAVRIVVAERHFLRACDDAVVAFAESLGRGCRVTYHCALDDPLLKVFGGERVRAMVRLLGIDEASPIESGLVARQVRAAQAKLAGRAGHDCAAESAEDWLRASGLGGYHAGG